MDGLVHKELLRLFCYGQQGVTKISPAGKEARAPFVFEKLAQGPLGQRGTTWSLVALSHIQKHAHIHTKTTCI